VIRTAPCLVITPTKDATTARTNMHELIDTPAHDRSLV